MQELVDPNDSSVGENFKEIRGRIVLLERKNDQTMNLINLLAATLKMYGMELNDLKHLKRAAPTPGPTRVESVGDNTSAPA